jgi:hypothetical protein
MWPSSMVESVCEVLADTDSGLTGDEIGRLLANVDVRDLDPSATKRHRLSYALLARQQRDQAGNCIVRFIAEAMAPGRHFKDPTRRQNIQDGLNERLLLMGLKVREDGRVAKASQTASTVDEAVRIAGRLKTELVRRGTHPEVLRYCEDELVRQSIFHAVFEAAKGVGGAPASAQRIHHRRQRPREPLLRSEERHPGTADHRRAAGSVVPSPRRGCPQSSPGSTAPTRHSQPQTQLLVRDIGRGPAEADRASQRTAPRSGHLTGTAATAARPPGEARHARGTTDAPTCHPSRWASPAALAWRAPGSYPD